MPEEKIVEIDRVEQAVVVAIQVRRLDQRLAEQMKRQIIQVAGQHPNRHVVVDMAQLDFVPSALMGAFVELGQVLRKTGQRFMLAGMNRQMRAAFAVTRLDTRLEIRDDVEAALASL